MDKSKEVKSMQQTVAALGGVDGAIEAVRKLRTGNGSLVETGAQLAQLSAEQLQVVAFCTRAPIADLRAVRNYATQKG